MSDFLPEGTRENDSASSASPGLSHGAVTGWTHSPGPQHLSFSDYAHDALPPLEEQPARPRLIPHIGHTILFFLIAFILLILTEIGAAVLYQWMTHGSRSHVAMTQALRIIATRPVFSIPTQAASYVLLILISFPVFESIWFESFGKVLHWNNHAAGRLFWRLLGLGLISGLVIGSFGNFLPMPKSPPILRDMMTSTAGAWIMFAFGTTLAPITEELAFRGFLLPSLLNIFRWAERKGFSTAGVTRYAGIPFAIIFTTIPFALLHASQVSDAWGPLLLIAIVSVILCIVRLATESVAACAIVHAAYNFVLFAGVVLQTSGFQHLHKIVR